MRTPYWGRSNQVAWPFTAIDQGEESKFIEAWMMRFADAAVGNFSRPRSMPEGQPQGSWRKNRLSSIEYSQSLSPGRLCSLLTIPFKQPQVGPQGTRIASPHLYRVAAHPAPDILRGL